MKRPHPGNSRALRFAAPSKTEWLTSTCGLHNLDHTRALRFPDPSETEWITLCYRFT